ncbi:hypothetical protein ACRALDRAFT_2042663 [Sodiomyces alcalophilus JCM 7366]|uniref:uncharacterized protein n=1 Tax=Sodiomyces alcalophilus JCM 7366 TaxID=591952 RepID=UPI0039B5F1F1
MWLVGAAMAPLFASLRAMHVAVGSHIANPCTKERADKPGQAPRFPGSAEQRGQQVSKVMRGLVAVMAVSPTTVYRSGHGIPRVLLGQRGRWAGSLKPVEDDAQMTRTDAETGEHPPH